MTESILIAVAGASGRMGQLVVQQVLGSSYATLTGATVSRKNPLKDEALTTLFPKGPADLIFSAQPEQAFQSAEVIIDFTGPDTLETHLDIAQRQGIGLVIGTTGLSSEQFHRLEQASSTIPILYSANFSVGLNVLIDLVKQASKKLEAAFDIEILEMHHRHKQDAPSGTALRLGQAAAEGRNLPFQEVAVYDRTQQHQERGDNDIGFAVLRGGSVVGDHTVIFASDEEVIELSHRALTREMYAKGALKAALWLAKQKAGYYKFSDLLTSLEKSGVS